MGQDGSKEGSLKATPEQLSIEIARRFADKCFTPLELTHFKDNFKTLAEDQDGLQYWKEETLVRFLALPDSLQVGPVIFQLASYLGAFPFPSLSPAILTKEALVKVIVLATERQEKVLKRGRKDRDKLLFRSLAVFDRRLSVVLKADEAKELNEALQSPKGNAAAGFSVDEPGFDDDAFEDDDELALAALESLDAMEVYRAEDPAEKQAQNSQIPVDNFRRLLMLLLLTATMRTHEQVAHLKQTLTDSRMERTKRIADSILWLFTPEVNPAISFKAFMSVVSTSTPYLFDGLCPLFEHFLFSKKLDFTHPHSQGPKDHVMQDEPPLVKESEILDISTLSQLSLFIRHTEIFNRLRILYSGDDAGFSINSITQKILKWEAPSILLVSGNRLDPTDDLSGREKAFAESLPLHNFPEGTRGNTAYDSNRVVFGAYLNVPWKQTFKEAIGDEQTLLFQLEPIHEVFHASSINRDFVTLGKSGVGFGVPLPKRTHSSSGTHVQLGAVSLFLDENLEYGVFTHDSSGGGAFKTSQIRKTDWQDRFEIESLEVWGCGGDEEAEKQREAWKWEEREAEARRHIKLGKDKDADYALLEMAGLVGGHSNSGGSMG